MEVVKARRRARCQQDTCRFPSWHLVVRRGKRTPPTLSLPLFFVPGRGRPLMPVVEGRPSPAVEHEASLRQLQAAFSPFRMGSRMAKRTATGTSATSQKKKSSQGRTHAHRPQWNGRGFYCLDPGLQEWQKASSSIEQVQNRPASALRIGSTNRPASSREVCCKGGGELGIFSAPDKPYSAHEGFQTSPRPRRPLHTCSGRAPLLQRVPPPAERAQVVDTSQFPG